MPVVPGASTSSQLEYAPETLMHDSLNCHTGERKPDKHPAV